MLTDVTMENLRNMPFKLCDEDIAWVRQTLAGMSTQEKLGQLFCVMFESAEQQEVDAIYDVLRPGLCMYRVLTMEKINRLNAMLQGRNRIPMIVASNLEKGGNGIISEGEYFASPLELAATGNTKNVERMAEVCARQSRAVGGRLSFSPIVDIDSNFRNPITNTRTFGSNPDTVREMSVAFVKKLQELGVAASVKHFPGDGQDERNQHLVTSVNDMDCETWDASYGRIYRECFEAGAMACMVGHILQPAWSKRLNPQLKDEDILPASLSKELLQGLLREHLGFNGLIITDASTMAGFTIPLPREQAVPLSIEAGADVFLFTRNLREDYHFMQQGLKNGLLSAERLDAAVIRILGMKAALGLHKETFVLDPAQLQRELSVPLYRQWARECADEAITLVKDRQALLPLCVQKTPRVLFYKLENTGGLGRYNTPPQCAKLCNMLRAEGFQVEEYEPEHYLEGRMRPVAEIVASYDLIIYVANIMTKSNQTAVRINWSEPMGCNCIHYQSFVPTLFISIENPYHLLDVPRVRTYINTYSSADVVLEVLVDKLMGRSPFVGHSPVDPFCGKWDARL